MLNTLYNIKASEIITTKHEEANVTITNTFLKITEVINTLNKLTPNLTELINLELDQSIERTVSKLSNTPSPSSLTSNTNKPETNIEETKIEEKEDDSKTQENDTEEANFAHPPQLLSLVSVYLDHQEGFKWNYNHFNNYFQLYIKNISEAYEILHEQTNNLITTGITVLEQGKNIPLEIIDKFGISFFQITCMIKALNNLINNINKQITNNSNLSTNEILISKLIKENISTDELIIFDKDKEHLNLFEHSEKLCEETIDLIYQATEELKEYNPIEKNMKELL